MKKLTALLLGAAMAFSLAACSGTDSSSSESTAPESSSAAEDTSSEASGEEASGTASAETASYDVETVEDGVLIMSTNAAFPPYEMTNDAGEYEGIDVEMAGEIAKRLGLELEIDDMDFDSALLAVQQGKSDIAMAASPFLKTACWSWTSLTATPTACRSSSCRRIPTSPAPTTSRAS